MARTAVVWLGHGLRGARWRADSIGVSALHSTAVGRAGGERPIYKRQPATALQRADGIEAWPEGTRAGEGMAWGSAPPCDPADPPSIFERSDGGGTLLAPFLLGSGDEINPTRRADRKPCMELFDRETEAAEAEGCMEPNQIVRSWLFLHNGLGEARRKAWGGRLDDSRTTDHVAFLATTRLNEMGAARCLCKIIFNFVVVAGQVRFLAFMVKEAEYHVALFWTVINLLCKRLPK